MGMFTLLDRVEIQLFYKVVNIIQEYVPLNYYYNHYTTTKSPQQAKMLQRYTKANISN
jgi:hypothetical protein